MNLKHCTFLSHLSVLFTGLCFLCAYCSVFEIMINYNILNRNNMQQQRSSMRPKPPSLAQLKRWTWGKKSVNCKTNLALCCAKCHVLSLYVLFGQFSAYFPIPYSLDLYSRLSYVKSNCNTVELLVIGNLFTTTAVKPCLNKFYQMNTNFLGFTFYFINGKGNSSQINICSLKKFPKMFIHKFEYFTVSDLRMKL